MHKTGDKKYVIHGDKKYVIHVINAYTDRHLYNVSPKTNISEESFD